MNGDRLKFEDKAAGNPGMNGSKINMHMKLYTTTKLRLSFRVMVSLVLLTFTALNLTPVPIVYAQTPINLPVPGTMVTLSSSFTPPLIKGLSIHPDNPFQIDFIVHVGDDKLQGEALKAESTKLIKYFLTALTVPEDKMWVNLSPYEKDRIIPDEFKNTEMGRDLLAQDYLLKQLTASLVYPEEHMGKTFWERIYKEAYQEFGTTDIPMDTFNKVWIIPEKARVYVHENNVFVTESRLKVMLEEDFTALNENQGVGDRGQGLVNLSNVVSKPYTLNPNPSVSKLSSQIVREVIIPAIEEEVNQGKNFSKLRQIFSSVILATWYKNKLKDSFLNQVYADKNKTFGLETDDKEIHLKIYDQYVQALKKGVYNYIKEDVDVSSGEVIPRKYFSGGVVTSVEVQEGRDGFMLEETNPDDLRIVPTSLEPQGRSVPLNEAEFTEFLGKYDGTALTLEAFMDDINRALGRSDADRINQEAVIAFFNNDTHALKRGSFSPAVVRLIVHLVAKVLLENKASLSKDKFNPVLGSHYFREEIDWPISALISFYHPQTGVLHRLSFSPRSEDSSDVMYFLYAESPTGHTLAGYAAGTLGNEGLQTTGDIPDELKKLIVFFQSNLTHFTGDWTPGFSVYSGSLVQKADTHSSFEFFEKGGAFKRYAEFNMEFFTRPRGHILLEMGGKQLDINLTPLTSKNELPDGPESSFSALERQLYWRNQWTNYNVNYRGKLEEVYAKMLIEGTLGRTVLEIGGGDEPLTGQFNGTKVVSLDMGVPSPVLEKGGDLFVKADIEALDSIPEEGRAAINKFLGQDESTSRETMFHPFDMVVLSNILNYVNAKTLAEKIAERIKPGTKVIVQNAFNQGVTEAFSKKGVKSNRDVLESFDKEYFEIKHIYGFIDRSSKNFLSLSLDRSTPLEELSYEQALSYEGVLYLILERNQTPYKKRQSPDGSPAAVFQKLMRGESVHSLKVLGETVQRDMAHLRQLGLLEGEEDVLTTKALENKDEIFRILDNLPRDHARRSRSTASYRDMIVRPQVQLALLGNKNINGPPEIGEIKYLVFDEVEEIYRDVKEAFKLDGSAGKILKPDNTPVTIADFLVDVKMRLKLNELFPEDGIVSEEGLNNPQKFAEFKALLQKNKALYKKHEDDVRRFEELMKEKKTPSLKPLHRWVMDPLDGTREFTDGKKGYSFLLARETFSEDTQEYRTDYAFIYSPEATIDYKGRIIHSPAAETVEVEGVMRVMLFERAENGRVNVIDGDIRFKREDDAPLTAWKVFMRTNPRFGENPYGEQYKARYGQGNVLSGRADEGGGLWFYDMLGGKIAAYNSTMHAWDHTPGRFMVEVAGGTSFRVHNFGQLQALVTRGGVHADAAREILGDGAKPFTGHQLTDDVYEDARDELMSSSGDEWVINRIAQDIDRFGIDLDALQESGTLGSVDKAFQWFRTQELKQTMVLLSPEGTFAFTTVHDTTVPLLALLHEGDSELTLNVLDKYLSQFPFEYGLVTDEGVMYYLEALTSPQPAEALEEILSRPTANTKRPFDLGDIARYLRLLKTMKRRIITSDDLDNFLKSSLQRAVIPEGGIFLKNIDPDGALRTAALHLSIRRGQIHHMGASALVDFESVSDSLFVKKDRKLYVYKPYDPKNEKQIGLYADRNNPFRETLAAFIGQAAGANTVKTEIFGEATLIQHALSVDEASLPQKDLGSAEAAALVFNVFIRKLDESRAMVQRSAVGRTFINFDHDLSFHDTLAEREDYLQVLKRFLDNLDGTVKALDENIPVWWKTEDFDVQKIWESIERVKGLNIDQMVDDYIRSLPDVIQEDTRSIAASYVPLLRETQRTIEEDVRATFKVVTRGGELPSAEEAKAPGGIDLNPVHLNLKEEGEELYFRFDNTGLNPDMSLEGLIPVIINILPIPNFNLLFGKVEEEKEKLVSGKLVSGS